MINYQAGSKKEEATLWRDYNRAPTPKKREDLILWYKGYVRKIVANLHPTYQQFEDWLSAGYIGLIEAVDRFDPNCGVTFSSYAYPTIVGTIKNNKRDFGQVIKCDRASYEAQPCYYRAIDIFIFNQGRAPENDTELALFLGCPVEAIWAVRSLGANHEILSFDTYFCQYGDTYESLHDSVADPALDSRQETENLAVRLALESLPIQLKQVIVLRYFYDFTQEQVGKACGISQMHVSRLQRKAEKLLRSYFSEKDVFQKNEPSKSRPNTDPKEHFHNRFIKEFKEAVAAIETNFGRARIRHRIAAENELTTPVDSLPG